ncbi:MAG TPA: 2-oxoglutarate and iron-dependent oxygenase domain-containing protein [Kineosporiaceae bacterium]|nr:2-oxoglutarate and iron-dependent oxygenase domain-containing protein [Kineosporiaceae bacterium]
MTLPLVDVSRFRDPAQREAFLADLRHAAHDVGFFYVVGHGIPPEVTDGVMAAAREFFALPLEQRLEIENVNSRHFRGYSRVGTERTGGAADQREQIDVGPERQAIADIPADKPYLRLVGPNQWPSAAPGLRPAVLGWLSEADRVAREVLRALSAALGQDETYFDAWFDDEAYPHVKVVRYPAREQVDSDQGVGAHKDYGWLALLLQDDLGGLQVEAADGSWIAARPVPGAFVVNIGELLEVATQGYLRATRHRVVSPAGRERFSIPFFLDPRLDAVVEPLQLPRELAAEARGVEDDPDNPLLAQYGEKSLLGWLRSHPKVAERWHPDLLARSR